MSKKSLKIILILSIIFLTITAIVIINFNTNSVIGNNVIQHTAFDSKTNDFVITYSTEENDIKNNIGTTIYHNTRDVISIESKDYSKSASKISNYLNYITYRELFNGDDKELLKAYENIQKVEEPLGIDTHLNTEFINDNILSIRIFTIGYLGGVGCCDVKGYNFSISTGNILTFNDLSDNTDELKSKTYEYAINYLKTDERSDQFYENWEDIVYENMFLDGNWYFSIIDNGITFQIEEYLIADGSNGSFAATVPFDVIDELITK